MEGPRKWEGRQPMAGRRVRGRLCFAVARWGGRERRGGQGGMTRIEGGTGEQRPQAGEAAPREGLGVGGAGAPSSARAACEGKEERREKEKGKEGEKKRKKRKKKNGKRK